MQKSVHSSVLMINEIMSAG